MAKAGCNAEESPSRTTSAHTFPAHELYVQPTAFRFEPSYRSQSPFTKEIGTGKLRRGRRDSCEYHCPSAKPWVHEGCGGQCACVLLERRGVCDHVLSLIIQRHEMDHGLLECARSRT